MLQCLSDQDFLAKLFCVRMAFEVSPISESAHCYIYCLSPVIALDYTGNALVVRYILIETLSSSFSSQPLFFAPSTVQDNSFAIMSLPPPRTESSCSNLVSNIHYDL